MPKRRLSQEMLKLIACVTMLVDHIGATLVPWYGLRMIGRISFPIFCFLLVEGFHHTRNRKRYGIRLALWALLCELPYDALFFGRVQWQNQNVMLTLFLGFLVLLGSCRGGGIRFWPLVAGCLAAEFLGADYGAYGIALIWLMALTRSGYGGKWLLPLGMTGIFYLMGSPVSPVLGIPIQLYGVLACIPLRYYSGKKQLRSPWVQWAFYLFYPAHLLILWAISLRV